MKTLIKIFLSLFLFSKLLAQDNPPLELYFNNYSQTRVIRVTIIPISMVFNGLRGQTPLYKYDFEAATRDIDDQEGSYYTYINGIGIVNDEKKYYLTVPANTYGSTLGFNFDNGNGALAFGCLGYGKYKVIVGWSASPPPPETPVSFDTVIVEYDLWGAPDVAINFRDDGGNPRLTYNGCCYNPCDEWPTTNVNKHIKMWRLYGDNPPACWVNYTNFKKLWGFSI